MDSRSHELHRLAHARLHDWARKRAADLDGLGWSGVSATENVLRGGASGMPFTPDRSSIVEQHVIERSRTLQTELAVRALPLDEQNAVVAKYLHDRTMSVWAQEHGIAKQTVSDRLSRAVIRVGRLLARWCETTEAPSFESPGPSALPIQLERAANP